MGESTTFRRKMMAFSSLPGSRWILRGFSNLRRRMGSRLNPRTTSAPPSCVHLPPPTRQGGRLSRSQLRPAASYAQSWPPTNFTRVPHHWHAP
ncbi:hypothetical protein MTO96_027814 [Rhipicephalus appendiculatus]